MPDCVARDCGPDDCDGSCGTCEALELCDLLTQECCLVDLDDDQVCDDNDCAPFNYEIFAEPTEIQNVRMTSKIEIEWDSAAPNSGNGTVHEALRGEIDQLPVGGNSETCIGPGTTDTSVIDITTPPSGTCYYYLVRGRNVCDA